MVESIGMQQQQVLQMSPVIVKVSIAQASQTYEVSRSFDRELEKLTAREGDKTKAVDAVPKELAFARVKRSKERRHHGRRAGDRPGRHRRSGDRGYQRRAADRGSLRRATDRRYRRRVADSFNKRSARGWKLGIQLSKNRNKSGTPREIFENRSVVDIVA